MTYNFARIVKKDFSRSERKEEIGWLNISRTKNAKFVEKAMRLA